EGCARGRCPVHPIGPSEAGGGADLNDINLLSFDFPGRTTNKCGRPAQAPPIALWGSSRLGGSLEPPWSGTLAILQSGMRRSTLLFALPFVLAIFTATTEPLKASPALSGVSEFKLDNGLQVIVVPDHRAPVVTHYVWYRVGSADEPAGVSGIAHFLE